MRTPAEALSEILERIRPLERRTEVPLLDAVGRVLASTLRSDLDLPPFDKSAVDGFAVRAADWAGADSGSVELTLAGESKAGEPWTRPVAAGSCVAIYTGAQLPPGADAVVMVEHSRRDGDRVRLDERPTARAHICNKGQDLRRGAVVAEPGRRLRAADLALLASIGCDPVPVFDAPRAAVWTTGDELVAVNAMPGPGQIRESNTQALAALCRAAGARVVHQGVVADDPAALRATFAEALTSCDLLVTTGGVSMGRYDLVGDALAACGVVPVFHKVAIKPGKPLWFGLAGQVPVFALPGNPVSCWVNHAVFVAPALARMGGERIEPRPARRGRWLGGSIAPNPREQHLPVRLSAGDDGVERLEPVRWNGSADVVGISQADGLAIVPIGAAVAAGDLLHYRPFA